MSIRDLVTCFGFIRKRLLKGFYWTAEKAMIGPAPYRPNPLGGGRGPCELRIVVGFDLAIFSDWFWRGIGFPEPKVCTGKILPSLRQRIDNAVLVINGKAK